MDQTQCIFLDVTTVKRLITEKDKKDRYKVDELIVAIFLANFCEKLWKAKCSIGFPLKNSQADFISPINNFNFKEIRDLLNTKIEQDHDVDVVIVYNVADNSKRAGQSFQIKRFNTYQPDLTTNGLIKFIQELKYEKTDTALIILLETGRSIKFTQIRNAIDFEHFPFSALCFVGLYGNILKFVEVWPDLGKEELSWLSI
ncbi:MAG: hypothetical protein P4L67_03755 [Candidatus Pacebacteria bacterium]|nr:hypothetical protein [Candidatus Paceibacterota bacterium]